MAELSVDDRDMLLSLPGRMTRLEQKLDTLVETSRERLDAVRESIIADAEKRSSKGNDLARTLTIVVTVIGSALVTWQESRRQAPAPAPVVTQALPAAGGAQ